MMKFITSFVFILTTLLYPIHGNTQFTNVQKAYSKLPNLLSNPGAELGKAGWTITTDTFSVTTTAANVGTGSSAFSWNSAGASRDFSSTAISTPYGLALKNGAASCNIQVPSGTATHLLQVFDSTNSAILSSATITSSTSYTRTTINFPFPAATTNIKLRLLSVAADEPQIYIDDCIIGDANLINLSQVNQAQFIGSAYIAPTTNCTGWARTSSTLGAVSSDADCPGPTIEFNPGPGTIQTTDTDLPKFTVNSLPPGNYQVLMRIGTVGISAGSNQQGYVAINDGTTTSGISSSDIDSTKGQFVNIVSNFVYTTSGNRTFELFVGSDANTMTVYNNASNRYLHFSIYRFPSTSELAYRPETLGWYVDATMDGANPDLGTTSLTSYTEITNSGLTLKPQTGSAAVGVMCSSTNAATTPSTGNTTCAAGDESVGINFAIPKAGAYEVCWYGAHYTNTSTSGSVQIATQLIETPTNAQTLTLEGGTRLLSGLPMATAQVVNPIANCSIFNWSSSGTKGVRLMYENNITATVLFNLILADANTSNGQRNMRWTVRPWLQNTQAPVLVGNNPNYTAQTTTYSAVINDYVDATSGTFTVTLPTAVGQAGKSIEIKNSGTGVLTLATTSSQTIFWASALASGVIKMGSKNDYIKVTSDGTNWKTSAVDIFVGARYTTNAGVSFADSTAKVVDFEDVVFDPWSAVTTGASWKFTCPVTGKYLVNSFNMLASGGAWSIGETANTAIRLDGVVVSTPNYNVQHVAHGDYVNLNATDTISCTAASYIDVRITQNSGGAIVLFNSGEFNAISITRVGN